jgi:hypothetical protein
MLACRLKTLDELDEVEEKEKQQREEGRTAANAGAVMPFSSVSTLGLEQSKVDPFTSLDIPLLPPRV